MKRKKVLIMIKLLYIFMLSLSSVNNIISNGSNESFCSRDYNVVDVNELNIKCAFEVDSSVHLEGAMSLSSNVKFWKEYASTLYGSKNIPFYTGYSVSSVDQYDSFTIDVTGVQGFKYTTNIQHFTQYGWSSWNDVELVDIYSFNFAIYRGANDDYDYLTIIYRIGDGTSREVRIVDFDSGLLSGELVSGINYSSTGTPILYYDAFVYANYTSFDYCMNLVVNDAYNDGFNDGYNQGVETGYNEGYHYGFTDGYADAAATDATASTIFTGILDVALVPVNVFLSIFNFDVFGINIAGIVSALLTLSVVIIIFRFLFGGKKDD